MRRRDSRHFRNEHLCSRLRQRRRFCTDNGNTAYWRCSCTSVRRMRRQIASLQCHPVRHASWTKMTTPPSPPWPRARTISRSIQLFRGCSCALPMPAAIRLMRQASPHEPWMGTSERLLEHHQVIGQFVLLHARGCHAGQQFSTTSHTGDEARQRLCGTHRVRQSVRECPLQTAYPTSMRTCRSCCATIGSTPLSRSA